MCNNSFPQTITLRERIVTHLKKTFKRREAINSMVEYFIYTEKVNGSSPLLLNNVY